MAAPDPTAPRRHQGHDERHAKTAEDLIRRLRSVEGHVRGIQRMVEDDAYCIDLLKQLKAVRAALDRVGEIALETHLETCVVDGLQADDAGDRRRVIAEILDVVANRART